MPPATALNHEGASAYALAPKHALAQYAATGCLSNTFYAGAGEQLRTVLALAKELDAMFIAKTAIYARTQASMKDMPALLLAILSTKNPALLKAVFPRVVDNGRMVRNFVQILRSGVTGRKSLGSAPKRLVEHWLNTASEQKLLDAAVGADPSLRDILRMVHPKPVDSMREALFGWALDKEYAVEALPKGLQQLIAYRSDRSRGVPAVPFQMLTALELSREAWAEVALKSGWQMVRMNLNTFARHGVFEIEGMAERVAEAARSGGGREGTCVSVPVDGGLQRRRRDGTLCREGGFAGGDGVCHRDDRCASGPSGRMSRRVGIDGLGGNGLSQGRDERDALYRCCGAPDRGDRSDQSSGTRVAVRGEGEGDRDQSARFSDDERGQARGPRGRGNEL